VLRLAFRVDGYDEPAGVTLKQAESGATQGVAYFAEVAESRRPSRNWAVVLLRQASYREGIARH
jgi:hypothetical protein